MSATGDRLLRGVLRQGWRRTATLLLASVTNALAVLAFPAVAATAIDRQVLGAGSGRAVAVLAGVLLTLVATEAVTELLTATSAAASTRVLRHRLLRHVLALGVAGRTRFASGDVVSRLVSNTTHAAGVGPAIAECALSLLLSVGGVVGLGLIDPWLAVAFLAGLPVGVAIVRVFVARTSRLVGRYLAALGTISGRLTEALAGARTIRVSGTVDRELDRVLRPAPELTAVGHDLWRTHGRVSWQGALFAAAMQLVVLTVAGFGVAAGRITPGELLASLSYVGLGLGLLGQASVLASLARARTGAERLAEILDQPAPRPGFLPVPEGPGELLLDDVTVRAGGRLVLDRVTLRVPAGRSVAVVGGSATGKSTLAAVAGRLLVPDGGRVLLDGVPLDRAAVRGEITYAFERPSLLGTTVADAIAFGAGHVPREAVRRAARLAGVDDVIGQLPAGYDTPLAEMPMSGGEAQRLGLARAIAHRGRLVILDDAMSSLDTVTELQVSRALAELLAGRTCLVIAHRPSTLARCDLVAWLADGRVRAVAPHGELWRDHPGYRALFQPEPALAGTA